ncbi:MAG TPA: thiamine pyrophosphate-binding protein [Solirubrobacteraceae bacterium]|jgi:acetolactate synthase-1/2/3 large subunit|nr:thiamine pyrophosphate-binding protein [Solirubrobacteraceae bacterium]
MQSSDWIAEALVAQGVDTVYEVVGGMIANFLDAIHRDGRIRIVSCAHEQAAGFSAEAHARMTGVPGVAMGTSGPGAINLLTPLGSCHFDSVPAVFITGQVNRAEQKGERPIRQLGFQETDIVAMAAPIAKAAWRVRTAEELPERLLAAFRLARTGRPGPVLLDIPMDLQRVELAVPAPAPEAQAEPVELVDTAAIDLLLGDLSAASRPLILAGGGIRTAGAVEGFRRLVDGLGVPVVNSLMGVDALPFEHPLRVGMIGTYGNRWANIALARADLLLVLGSRLDIRQTGADTDSFASGRPIHHVDCDPGELNNRVLGCRTTVAQLEPFVVAAGERIPSAESPRFEAWRSEIADLRARWPDTGELPDVPGINPNALMHRVSRSSALAAAYATDVGQHQMWAAQSLELGGQQRFLTSGGMGAMGSGLPFAVGACIAVGAPVVLIAGDGGFQLNIQELQTVARNELPLKIVILNNRTHGMVRQFQESYFDGRYQSTTWGYSAPDFVAVAAAFGISAGRADRESELESVIADMWRDPDSPFLLEVAIDTFANAYPKVAFGHPISEMEPFVAPKAMEST